MFLFIIFIIIFIHFPHLKSQLSIIFSEEEQIRHCLLAYESFDAIAHLK